MTWEKVKLLSWLFKTDVLVSSFRSAADMWCCHDPPVFC